MHHLVFAAGGMLVLCALGCAGAGASGEAASPGEASKTASGKGPEAQLDEGERMIEVAGGDCGAACAGLARVTSAKKSLCSGTATSCEKASTREERAKKQVASFCDPCGAP